MTGFVNKEGEGSVFKIQVNDIFATSQKLLGVPTILLSARSNALKSFAPINTSITQNLYTHPNIKGLQQ